jgi:hypothetical protein
MSDPNSLHYPCKEREPSVHEQTGYSILPRSSAAAISTPSVTPSKRARRGSRSNRPELKLYRSEPTKQEGCASENVEPIKGAANPARRLIAAVALANELGVSVVDVIEMDDFVEQIRGESDISMTVSPEYTDHQL